MTQDSLSRCSRCILLQSIFCAPQLSCLAACNLRQLQYMNSLCCTSTSFGICKAYITPSFVCRHPGSWNQEIMAAIRMYMYGTLLVTKHISWPQPNSKTSAQRTLHSSKSVEFMIYIYQTEQLMHLLILWGIQCSFTCHIHPPYILDLLLSLPLQHFNSCA